MLMIRFNKGRSIIKPVAAMNKFIYCKLNWVIIAVIALLPQTVHASVNYDFNPLRIYEDDTRPNNEQYFICAFDGVLLDFSDDAYVNDSKIKDIKIIENGSVVDGLRIELTDNPAQRHLTLWIDAYPRVLCGGPGNPYYYTVIFPEGLFGNKEWYDSKYAEGHSNPEITFDTQGYGEPYPMPDMMEGDYTLHIPSTGFNLRFERNFNCPDNPDYIQYIATVDKLDNKGFYVEYHQPMPGGYDVSGGYLVAGSSDVGFEYNNEDGSFGYFDYLMSGYRQEPLISFGDYDYIENAEITIESSAAATFSIRVVGVGKYNTPETPPNDEPKYVTLSISLPGGYVAQSIKANTDNEFFIRPEDSWNINTCQLGDEDITSAIGEAGLVILNITKDTTLSAVFEKDKSGIDNPTAENMKIYTRAGGIEILNKPYDATVMVYDIDGMCVYSGKESNIDLPAGLFVVKINASTFKFAVH